MIKSQDCVWKLLCQLFVYFMNTASSLSEQLIHPKNQKLDWNFESTKLCIKCSLNNKIINDGDNDIDDIKKNSFIS